MMPLFIDLSAKRVVVFGGGVVAARKAAYFTSDSDVQVFSRSFSKGITALPVLCTELDVADITDADLAELLKGAFICIAALSSDEQNNRIGRICHGLKILFNNANGDRGDLIIPSVLSGKHYRIAVSTDGKSPAVAGFIREQLETRFPDLDKMIVLQERLRQELKSVEPSQKRRRKILIEVLHDPVIWEALSRSQSEADAVVNMRYLHD